MIPEGYKWQTTFFSDFNIADKFGIPAIKDTYKRAFDGWKDNVLYMKELTACLNFKCWDFYHSGNTAFSEVYADLYNECYEKCLNHFKGDELHEYWDFLD